MSRMECLQKLRGRPQSSRASYNNTRDASGGVKWSMSTEIIQKFTEANDKLNLTGMNGRRSSYHSLLESDDRLGS